MNRIKTLLILLVFPFLIKAQENIDLFIWAGQSNAQGWTGNAAEYPKNDQDLDKSILLNWTFFGTESSHGEWIQMQAQKGRYPDGHFGPEVSFSREMKKAGSQNYSWVDEQHKFMEERPVVVKAPKMIAEVDPNIVFTSMYALPKADATHLTPTGLVEHGCRIFNAYNLLNSDSVKEIVHAGKLKVLTYNIWNGFDWGKDTLRRKQMRKWMENQQADVVALQELCAYTSEKLKEDASAWGHNYSVLLKQSGYSVGLTSRYPIELKEKKIDGLHHGALHGKTNGIDFLVVHLHPGSIKRRREETKILLEKLEQIKLENSKYIVLGDFNAQSPFDADLYDPDGYLLNRLRKSNKGKGIDGNLYLNDLDYSVIADFLSFPMYDVTKQYTTGMEERGSFPGRILASVNNETEEELVSRLERIDYILVSPGLIKKCVSSKICNGMENWYLSDHYPVIAEFIIQN